MQLRPYESKDLPPIQAVFLAAVEGSDVYTPPQRAAWAAGVAGLHRIEKETAFVVEHEGKILGFGGRWAEEIDFLFVHPDYWGQGIGSAIFMAMSQQCRPYVAYVSLQAHQFFLAQGFEVRSKETVVRQGVALERFVMVRQPKKDLP